MASQLSFEIRTPEELLFSVTSDPNHLVLEEFFQGYNRAFVLPNEKETLEGFRHCLQMNEGKEYARLSAYYGPYREVVMVTRHPASSGQDIIGGANMLFYPLHIHEAGGKRLSLLCGNLNYIYIDPAFRGKRYLRKLLSGLEYLAIQVFPEGNGHGYTLPMHIFIEQNDPSRMTAEAYAEDTKHSGVDQFERLMIWALQGARIVDFDYVQPPLSSMQTADDTLLYAVLGRVGCDIPAVILRQVLERFFSISVLKGRSILKEASVQRQFAQLDILEQKGEAIKLLNPLPYLQARRNSEKSESVSESIQHFRDLIFPWQYGMSLSN